MSARAAALLALAAPGLLSGCGGARHAATPARPGAAVLCPSSLASAPGQAQPRVRFDARRVLGLSVAGAERLAARYGCRLRAIFVDGFGPPLVPDLEQNRIDVYIARGVVYRLVGVY